MANSGAVRSGNLPRLIQLGVDSQVEHFRKDYVGVGSQIFKVVPHDKGIYESVQLAGMGPASLLGESAAVHQLDSIDQNWQYIFPIYHYAKAARVSAVAIEDNKYMDLVPILGQQVAHALELTQDLLKAAVFNTLATVTGPDTVAFASASHPLQAGGTSDNTISALAFGETALENMSLKVDAIKNPNGQFADLNSDALVIPSALKFEAQRVVMNPNKPGTPDRDINASYQMNIVRRVIVWKRLSSTTACFLTTDAMKGFQHISRRAVQTESFKNPNNLDIEIIAHERYNDIIEDWRAVVYNAGA